MKIREPHQDDKLQNNTIYINPADYHMRLSSKRRIELIQSEPINFSRPSIDYTMINAAQVFRKEVLGIVLSGANVDGANGLREIHSQGGICITQDPAEATYPQMPESASEFVPDAYVLKLADIANFLQDIPAA